MKKHLLKYAKVLVLIFVLTILNNCSVDKEITESNGVHFSPKNKKFTYQNFKNETGKQVDFIKSVNLSSNSLSMRGYDLKTDFLIDTSQVVKYIDPQTFKETYTFKIYPFNIELERNEYFNLIYESVGTDWNQIIFLNKNKENPSEYETPVESSEIVYNALSTSKGRTEVITYNFHCNALGPCANGICDMCSQCVSTTISYQYTPSMPEITENPGTGGGGGTGAGGTGAGGTTSGVYVPVSYNSQDIDLESPEFQLYLQIHNYISTLPNDLNALFNDTSNHFLYPTVFNYLFTNGVNFYTTGLVNQALNKYKNFINDFNPNWHNDYKDKFKLWALNQFMNAESEQNILSIRNKIVTGTFEEQLKYTIIDYLFSQHIDHVFAHEILDLIAEEPNQEDVFAIANMTLILEKHFHDFLINDDAKSHFAYFMDIDEGDPILTGIYISKYVYVKYRELRGINPEWTRSECLYYASSDLIHISLDVFGMVPLFGEPADLINGVLYTIEGDGLNATLSFASAVPIIGYGATTTKFSLKIINQASDITSKVKLVWKSTANGIEFGSRNQLRKVLGLTDNALQAHHIMPWASRNHDVIQKAAQSGNAFHMNEALNGIAVATWRNQPNHTTYNNLVKSKLDNFLLQNPNATPQGCYDFVSNLTQNIRNWVINNPNSHLNSLVLP